ncbi:MAG: homoserine dehydrogenase [Candidatus Melainabacteria bacterium]|nr:homoserine dehydrogenase [Candidatus Melainabacteria bacterium]
MGRVVLGMIGLGTVGTGVVQLLSQHRHLTLKKVAVRDPSRKRNTNAQLTVTGDVSEVIDDPEIEVLVEVMGGEQPALEYLERAIGQHKHIVTANKEVLAKHGPRLFQLAKKKGVAIFFEASVAGGIPLISTIHKGLEANRLYCVTGILNGTTNFILSNMEEKGDSFASSLATAQTLGFAEADPTADIDGHDVAYKLSILSALSYGRFVHPDSIYKESIRQISDEDIVYAAELGYRIKLIGTTQRLANNKLDVRVHPMFVNLHHPLASVAGSNNGILVAGDAIGELVLVGPGAGQMPTASAVVGDIINLASALQLPDFATYFQIEIALEWAHAMSIELLSCPFYLRLQVADTPGVIGQIGTIFGSHNVSIQSIIQRGVCEKGATIVILTHAVLNKNMLSAINELKKCSFLHELASCIAIFVRS